MDLKRDSDHKDRLMAAHSEQDRVKVVMTTPIQCLPLMQRNNKMRWS